MIDVAALHPLVLLAARSGLAFVLLPLAIGLARLVLGSANLARLEASHGRRRAAVLALGTAAAAAVLGADALDPRLVGAALASHPAARGACAGVFAALSILPLLASLRGDASDAPASTEARRVTIALAVVVCLPLTALLALRTLSRLPDGPDEAAIVARAGLRAAVVPTDPSARLALAFRFASAGELDRAREELAHARALGASRSRIFEVESELAAQLGDCAAAERLFRLAIEATLPTDPDEWVRTPLRLGGYRLPPSLVTRCRYGR